MFMKEFIKNTMKILQEKSHSEKVGITIGQISNIHSTKKVLTLKDYTGEIKALIQEKVIEAYRSMLCKNTILVLRNVTIQNSEGLPLFIAITFKNIYMIYVDEFNKVLGHGAKNINGLGDKAKNNSPSSSIQSNSEESL
ncbi:hypothetical protein GLOIN_2v722689 [Rhizophagus irregularis DAOM 181602=DAOM 197198]|nr:hypothetical protein GLOIN_2v722689 [Rhizophagus irregularis DAOM 181602=DAOM 197198]POG61204.1 hypothetical protein GLOIN_2v722689 [Rhizophagus irregularis DAOM 181602=DAOM 197198]|eukprot:XP_025168070.1 hypothetical protein GLOIN_2v722689 [Rhizophagus irregularis DAOM 181602=DAOM 197198]